MTIPAVFWWRYGSSIQQQRAVSKVISAITPGMTFDQVWDVIGPGGLGKTIVDKYQHKKYLQIAPDGHLYLVIYLREDHESYYNRIELSFRDGRLVSGDAYGY